MILLVKIMKTSKCSSNRNVNDRGCSKMAPNTKAQMMIVLILLVPNERPFHSILTILLSLLPYCSENIKTKVRKTARAKVMLLIVSTRNIIHKYAVVLIAAAYTSFLTGISLLSWLSFLSFFFEKYARIASKSVLAIVMNSKESC